jgi:hypothetical protein
VTPDEHAAEAERLLKQGEAAAAGQIDPHYVANFLLAAQVHATLSLRSPIPAQAQLPQSWKLASDDRADRSRPYNDPGRYLGASSGDGEITAPGTTREDGR